MIKKLLLAVCSCVLFFLILEGLCSTLFVAYKLWSTKKPSRTFLQYDPDLGWASIPNFYDKNYFAPGIYMRTNSRGFRANEEFTERVPPGKLRIICSGDSQTQGFGVDNDHTWCQLLESIDLRLQTVNMGEGGYAPDQMYLWYKRDGTVFDHNVQFFAVNTYDLSNLQAKSLGLYGKPVLEVRNGELVTSNVPVPKQSPFLHRLGLKRNQIADVYNENKLRSITLLGWLFRWALPARTPPLSNGPTDQQRQVFDKMVEDLQTINKQKNSVLVLVYLPATWYDYEEDGASRAWRSFIREVSVKRGVAFFDLVDEFQKLPVTMKDGMFIWAGSGAVRYSSEAPGHLDDQGQEWVAKELYGGLLSIPEVVEMLAGRADHRSEGK
jgi:hypothetical protein